MLRKLLDSPWPYFVAAAALLVLAIATQLEIQGPARPSGSAADIAKKVGCTVNLVYVIKSKMGQAGKRGPGRPSKVSTSGMDDLQGIVAAVKNTERERAQMRAALEKIQAVLADALG